MQYSSSVEDQNDVGAKARIKTEDALLNFCEKITKKQHQSVEELGANEAKKILIALENLR